MRVDRQRLGERLTAQGLAGEPLKRPEDVAERLLAVQGQDPRGARLAVRARTTGVDAADVDRALSEDRSLLITWLNRGTLHLVRSEDYPWLQALTTPPLLTSCSRRLRHEGVSESAAERAMEAIERALAAEGPLRREGLRERLSSAGVPTAGQAFIHLMFLAAVRASWCAGRCSASSTPTCWSATGSARRGRSTGRRPWRSWRAATWSGTVRPTTATSLAGPGCRCGTPAPASPRSPPSWASARTASSTSPSGCPAEPLPPPRLLGAFDPLLLGWTSREEIVGPHKMLVTINGIFRPFALVDGRAVATWRLAGGKLTIEHLGKVTKKAASALEADADEVTRFLGL